MTWNYRVFKHDDGENTRYALHEVYYDEHDVIIGYADEPETGYFKTPGELISDIHQMLNDAERSQHDVLIFNDDHEATLRQTHQA